MRICVRLTVAFLLLIPVVRAQQSPSPGTNSPLAGSDLGVITKSNYRNSFFSFTFRIPFGWVDRTQDMREGSGESGKAALLLEVFERPPQAIGNTVNSAVAIAAESVSSYPGLKSAAQYFGPLSDLSKEKGLAPVNEPYEFPVDGKPIVRRDFMKQMGSVTMHQSTMAMLAKGYVLSFTMIGGSDDEVTGLVEILKFGPVGKERPKRPGR